jgi:hypothetical protein
VLRLNNTDVVITRRVCVDQMCTLDWDAEARYTPFGDKASAVTEPNTFLSVKVDVLDQSVRDTVIISENR